MATKACEAGLAFQLPKGYKPGDFIYGESGPWPSPPQDDNACKVAPEVKADGPHCIPEEEEKQWQHYLGDYLSSNVLSFAWSAIDYSAKLLGVPLSPEGKAEIEALVALWLESGIRADLDGDSRGPYPALDDASFTDLIAHGLLSKLMSELDPPDRAMFEEHLKDKSREFWKCDLTHMRVVRKTWKGEYVAPSVVLLSRSQSPAPGQEYDFRVDGIALFVQTQPGGPYDKKVVLAPWDGKAWQLAKYFALQGALVRLNLIDHTMVHFPFDAINAITKSVLPTSNRVLQLLLPHLFLSLPVDNSVLEGPYSLLNRTWTYPYSPYPAAGDEIRKVFPFYWWGSETEHDAAETWASGRDNAFPPYRFRTEPRAIPSKYGTFLNAYYEPILQFATGVVASIPADGRDWEAISWWADRVASWIPGFPDGSTIYKNSDLLAKTCASIIWNGAIVHTADHWLMHQMFEQRRPTPYIMRDQPPQSASPGVDPDYRPTVHLIDDVLPPRLCDLMFFQPHSSTFLGDFHYSFQPSLDGLVEKFRKVLTATDDKLHAKFPEFGIKLHSDDPSKKAQDCFATGVQF
jgi:hypothetical protein